MRATEPIIRQRVEDVLRIRLDGAEGWDVRRYVAEQEAAGAPPWTIPEGGKPLSERQIRYYVAAADKLMDESCRQSRRKRLRRHLAQRRALFARAVNKGDERTALAVLRDEAELLGLYPAARIKAKVKAQHTGAKGGPIQHEVSGEHEHHIDVDHLAAIGRALAEAGALDPTAAGPAADPPADEVRPPQAPPQTGGLLLPHREAMYGGAAGGGKSVALLMAALQYVDHPDYHALILRRTFQQLSKPGALMDLAKQWLYPTDARWSGQEHKWLFPSGATLEFGHCEHEDSVYNYQGPAYQYVAYDELTQFSEKQYRYLFSRLRRTADSAIPIRMRAASNPGGVGHEWVKRRFLIEGAAAGRVFMPAKLDDNPSLDRAEYVASLAELDPVTRAQLLAGDWDAYQGGRFFKEWFRSFTRRPDAAHGEVYVLQKGDPAGVSAGSCWRFCTIDPACTEKETSDYTAIITFAVAPNRDLLILDVVRKRLAIDRIAPEVTLVCQRWKPQWVGIESTGFQTAIYDALKKQEGVPAVKALFPEGKGKLVRATPAIIRCEAGQVYLPESAPWLEDFVAELVQFTGDEKQDAHDDQVDAFAYAVQQLDQYPPLIHGPQVPNPSRLQPPPLNRHPDAAFGDWRRDEPPRQRLYGRRE
jgi:predicted phage terminase large subunit-like protein